MNQYSLLLIYFDWLTARLISPMQIQGTELLSVTTHFEWSLDDLYEQVSNPFTPFIANDLIFMVLRTISSKIIFVNIYFIFNMCNITSNVSTHLYWPEQDELNLSCEFNQVSVYTFDCVIFAIKSSYRSIKCVFRYHDLIISVDFIYGFYLLFLTTFF